MTGKRAAAKLLNFLSARRAEDELEREVSSHLALLEDEHLKRGMNREEARLAAKRSYGGVEQAKECQRQERSFIWLEQTRRDVRSALRLFRKSPVFTIVALSSLALGIGANTAIFSVIDAVLSRSLPVSHPDELVLLSEAVGNKEVSSVLSYPVIRELESRNHVLAGLAGRYQTRMNLSSDGAAKPLNGELVTGDYFRTLGIRPALGRLLNENDVLNGGANPVCVISYGLWTREFGGDPAILGRKLTLNSRPYTVVGVTQRGFEGSRLQIAIDIQVPASSMSDFLPGFSNFGNGPAWRSAHFKWLAPIGRLRPGVGRKRAEASLQALAHVIARQNAEPGEDPDRSQLQLKDGSQGTSVNHDEYGAPLTVLMGVVGLVLLIACANLANLLLARAATRQKEFALRLALGASRGRLVRQLLVENFMLAAAGGICGLMLSFWITQILVRLAKGGTWQVAVNTHVIGFAVLISFACALLFGLVPAWQSARPDVLPQLKRVSAGDPFRRESLGTRKLLVVVQIGLSIAVVFAAGLLTRTLSDLQAVDLGFQAKGVVALSLDSSARHYSEGETDRVFDSILTRLRAQPQIAAASFANIVPLEGTDIQLGVKVPGRESKASDIGPGFDLVSSGYFATLRQPVFRGREFSDRDGRSSPRVAIVNEAFASQYMPGVQPVGRHIQAAGGNVEIVGLVKTAHYVDYREAPRPQIYLPLKQAHSSGATLLVRTLNPPAGAAKTIEAVIHSVDKSLPVTEVSALQEQIERGIWPERTLSFLSSLFGAIAMLLCAIGLYGIVSYAVSSRTREIGVRFAIGASRKNIAWLFGREMIVLLSLGAAVGIPAALVSTRYLKSILFGLGPSDPTTLLLTLAILLAVGLIATFLPVRRAAAIKPITALRYE